MGKQWIIQAPSSCLSEAAERWKVPPIVAQLLLNRGVTLDDSGDAFLTPQLKDLHPPELLPGASEAARVIAEAIERRTPIVLYGDYDVDGTAGLAILWHVLNHAGARLSFYVPHRVEEGYGFNPEAVHRLIKDGAGLVISIDCGITAVTEADLLADSGVQFIVTDHHPPQATLPKATAIVHPRLGDRYPNPDLCGAGVAFKLAWAIAQRLSGAPRVSQDYRELLMEMLPLAALGTIADVVPLAGENRIIVRHGLGRLPQSKLPGLQALIESAGLSGGKIHGSDVGFKLAPRINAAGRMGHARLAVELFTKADAARAREIALYLEEHNRSRRAIERKMSKQAIERIETHDLAGDGRRAIVLSSKEWHAGVIGIVAARMVDRYHRPVIIITCKDGKGQGSGRSIRHFDLGVALASCREHLISYGGHAMAAGVRVAEDRIEAFTEAFVEVANRSLTGQDLVDKLHLDTEVRLEDLTLPTAEAIAGLGPFGAGNPRPKFATDWIELAKEPRLVGQDQGHLQASFRQNGVCMKAIGFGLGSAIEDLKQLRRCRVAFEPIINDFNGRRSVEMQMIDLQFAR